MLYIHISGNFSTINNLRFLFIAYLFVIGTSSVSCKKLIEIDSPKNEIVTESVFKSDGTANSAMAGIYSQMIGSSGFASGGFNSVTLLTGLSSDELVSYSSDANYLDFNANSLLPSNTLNASLWTDAYKYIYYCNSIVEGLAKATGVSESMSKQLEGEAKFLRAFCYYYLVALYGEVPLVLSTDYHHNSALVRESINNIGTQIIKDLDDAKILLREEYDVSNQERIRPVQASASALLARVYVFLGDWVKAEGEASIVIANPLFALSSNLNSVFLANSSEAIWQLKPVLSINATNEGSVFILNSPPSQVALRTEYIQEFEEGDEREAQWINSFTDIETYYFPYKYKISSDVALTEYSMVLRLAEQYLIRAEARIHQNNIEGAVDDLNVLRARARALPTLDVPNPLPPLISTLNKNDALSALVKERKFELFSEWGHRWFDLKRANLSDEILNVIKAPNWHNDDTLYPVPKVEIDANPLITQNPSY